MKIIIARTCFVAGFLWLIGVQAYYFLGADVRTVMRIQQETFTWDEACYSKDEIYKRVLAAAETAHNQSPDVIWPSLLMLLGGTATMRRAKASAVGVKNGSAA